MLTVEFNITQMLQRHSVITRTGGGRHHAQCFALGFGGGVKAFQTTQRFGGLHQCAANRTRPFTLARQIQQALCPFECGGVFVKVFKRLADIKGGDDRPPLLASGKRQRIGFILVSDRLDVIAT